MASNTDAVEVEQHQLAWNGARGSAVRVRLKGQPNWSGWVKVSSADLAAIAAILNESPVYFTRAGTFHTGEEPTG